MNFTAFDYTSNLLPWSNSFSALSTPILCFQPLKAH